MRELTINGRGIADDTLANHLRQCPECQQKWDEAERLREQVALHAKSVKLEIDGIRVVKKLECLSPQQNTIAEMIAEGWSNTHIADTLSISPRTCEKHVGVIYERLGLRRVEGVQPRSLLGRMIDIRKFVGDRVE